MLNFNDDYIKRVEKVLLDLNNLSGLAVEFQSGKGKTGLEYCRRKLVGVRDYAKVNRGRDVGRDDDTALKHNVDTIATMRTAREFCKWARRHLPASLQEYYVPVTEDAGYIFQTFEEYVRLILDPDAQSQRQNSDSAV